MIANLPPRRYKTHPATRPELIDHKKKKQKEKKPAAAGTGESIDRGLTTGFTTG